MDSGKDGDQGALVGTHAPSSAGADGAIGEDMRLVIDGPRESGNARVLPAAAVAGVAIAPQRVRGRRKGSGNLRDTAIAAELVARYGDPLEADVAIGTMPPGELVTLLRVVASDRGLTLGMTVGDVLALQRDCRRNAMPFIHSKRATVDDKGNPVVPIIGIGSVGTLNVGGGRSIEDVIDGEAVEAETITDQGDSDAVEE